MSRKLGAKLLEKLSETAKREAEQRNPSETAPAAKKIKIVLDLTAGKVTRATTPEEILSEVLLSSSQQDKNFEFLKFKKNLKQRLQNFPLQFFGCLFLF